MQPLGMPAQQQQVRGPQKLPGPSSRWKAKAEFLQRELIVVWLVLRRPATPWYSKMIAGCVVAYLVSPVQLIPSFIPVIGFMDDAAVIAVGLWLIRMLTPENVLRDACAQADAARVYGDHFRPGRVRATSVMVAGIWLALTVGLFFVLWKR